MPMLVKQSCSHKEKAPPENRLGSILDVLEDASL